MHSLTNIQIHVHMQKNAHIVIHEHTHTCTHTHTHTHSHRSETAGLQLLLKIVMKMSIVMNILFQVHLRDLTWKKHRDMIYHPLHHNYLQLEILTQVFNGFKLKITYVMLAYLSWFLYHPKKSVFGKPITVWYNNLYEPGGYKII